MATILLVDDDEDIRDSIRVVLEAEGHRAVEAADRYAALQRAVAQARLDHHRLLDARLGWSGGDQEGVCPATEPADDVDAGSK